MTSLNAFTHASDLNDYFIKQHTPFIAQINKYVDEDNESQNYTIAVYLEHTKTDFTYYEFITYIENCTEAFNYARTIVETWKLAKRNF